MVTLTSGNLITTKWSVSSLTVESDKYDRDVMKVRAWEQSTVEPLQLGLLLSNSCRSITCVTCNTNTVYNIVPPPFKQPLSLFDSHNHFLLILMWIAGFCFLLAIWESTSCSSDMYSMLTERHKPLSLLLVWSGCRETSFKAALDRGVSAVG